MTLKITLISLLNSTKKKCNTSTKKNNVCMWKSAQHLKAACGLVEGPAARQLATCQHINWKKEEEDNKIYHPNVF